MPIQFLIYPYLQHVQTSLARVVTSSITNTTTTPLQLSIHVLAPNSATNRLSLVYRTLHNVRSQCLSSSHLTLSFLHSITSASLCVPQSFFTTLYPFSQPCIHIALASHGCWHAGPYRWNSLPHHLRSIDSYTAFKSNLNTHLFSGTNNSVASDATVRLNNANSYSLYP